MPREPPPGYPVCELIRTELELDLSLPNTPPNRTPPGKRLTGPFATAHKQEVPRPSAATDHALLRSNRLGQDSAAPLPIHQATPGSPESSARKRPRHLDQSAP